MAKFMTLEGLQYLWTQLKGKLADKVDRETGKGLSANDYTTQEKNKLAGIATGANNYTHPVSGITEGVYRSVEVNEQGHVVKGTNPTTLSGYGITDAAQKQHTHNGSDIASLDASKLTGTIDAERLPDGILEGITNEEIDAVLNS